MNPLLILPIVSFISIMMRLIPFLAGKWLQRLPFLHKLSVTLPCCLLTMITAYTLHDLVITSFPFAIPEFSALCCVVIAQVLFRKILLSMAVGVLVDQLLRVILLTS